MRFTPDVNRRAFLKLSTLAGAAAFLPSSTHKLLPWPPREVSRLPMMLGRVAIQAIYLYSSPEFSSPRLDLLKRDTILHLQEQIISPYGPAYNPRWYILQDGFVHSGYIQRVDPSPRHPPLRYIPDKGRLGEITVPFSQSYRQLPHREWSPLYRLYYGSVHWITDLLEGPDGQTWYQLTDERLHVKYCVPAAHIRPIAAEELSPLSPEVPSDEKSIVVSIAEQVLNAYEGDQLVFSTLVSSGLHSKELPENGIPTDTPEGHFRISVKMPSRHMGDGEVTSDVEAYELLGVPWVSFFHQLGIAFHGTYWHDNFGRRMSHGCVNMRNEDAKWLYRWCLPAASAQEWWVTGAGTRVAVLSPQSD